MKKFLRGLAIFILVVVAIPFIAAFFITKDYHIERSVEIKVPREVVFNYLIFLRNQQQYGVWNQTNPETDYNYRGTDGTVGFVVAWDSNDKNRRKGEQEITHIIPNERIDYRLRFIKPFRSESDSWLALEDVKENTTRVIWGVKGRMGYPLNFFLFLIGMEKRLGDELEQGLQNLKDHIPS